MMSGREYLFALVGGGVTFLVPVIQIVYRHAKKTGRSWLRLQYVLVLYLPWMAFTVTHVVQKEHMHHRHATVEVDLPANVINGGEVSEYLLSDSMSDKYLHSSGQFRSSLMGLPRFERSDDPVKELRRELKIKVLPGARRVAISMELGQDHDEGMILTEIARVNSPGAMNDPAFNPKIDYGSFWSSQDALVLLLAEICWIFLAAWLFRVPRARKSEEGWKY